MNYIRTFAVCIVIVMSFFWFNLKPTINPEHIELIGKLTSVEQIQDPIWEEYSYALTIKISSVNNSRLIGDNYFSSLYIYLDDFFIQSQMSGAELKKEGFNIMTTHGNTVTPAIKKLAEVGVILPTNHTDLGRLHGLIYFGDSFPAEIQYYVTNVKFTSPQNHKITNDKPDLDNSYLVYSHYEKRWGKDLSWVRLFKVSE